MDIRELRFFCMAAELEHVSKAADKLGVAQPYLTKIIGQIENELGVQLFDKVGRQVKLNQYGEIFYKQAKKTIACMENIYTEMDYALDKKERTVTFLCNTETYTAGMIIEFQKRNSNYSLKIQNGAYCEMAEALATGEADFVFCSPPLEEDNVKGLRTEIICRDIAYVLLPPGHRLLEQESVKFTDLQDERLLTSEPGGTVRNHVDVVFEKYGIRHKIVCETGNLNLIIRGVGCGLGYAFISKISLDQYPEMRQYTREITDPERFGTFGLSYNVNNLENRNFCDFKSFIEEYYGALQERISADDNWLK